MIQQERLLTARQVAERIGVDTATVWKWARAGKVPARRFGRLVRFDEREIVRGFGWRPKRHGDSSAMSADPRVAHAHTGPATHGAAER